MTIPFLVIEHAAAHECRLTLRSRRPSTAWHLGREPLWFIIRLAAQAPIRGGRLSSNVRALMKEWTGIEVQRARQALEQASASTLGHMLFAFSRLDMILGLALVWVDGGNRLEKLTKEIADYSFNKKLGLLAELSSKRYSSDPLAVEAYTQWLALAHQVRVERNDLVHGRWGVDHMNDQVVNVVGLPTGDQTVRRYTIPELKAALRRMQRLVTELDSLRERWPL